MNSLDWMLRNSINGILDLDYIYETELFVSKYTLNLGEPDEQSQSVVTDDRDLSITNSLKKLRVRSMPLTKDSTALLTQNIYKFSHPLSWTNSSRETQLSTSRILRLILTTKATQGLARDCLVLGGCSRIRSRKLVSTLALRIR